MIVFGCDPGRSGAICAMHGTGEIIGFCRLNEPYESIADWVRGVAVPDQSVACVERIQSFGKKFSIVKLVESYGFVQGVFASLGVPVTLVRPQDWQKTMNCMTGGDKRISRDAARRVFANEHITIQTADAALIAKYATIQKGQLS